MRVLSRIPGCTFLVLLSFLFLASVCDAQSQEPKESEAAASSPWDSPAPADLGNFVFFPPRNTENFITEDAMRWGLEVLCLVEAAAPVGFGTVGDESLRRDLRDMEPPHLGTDVLVPDSHIEDLAKFMGSTHWATSTLVAENGEWIVTVKYTTPAGLKEQEFRCAEGEDLKIASACARWLMQESGVPAATENSKAIKDLPYGETLKSVRDVRFVKPYLDASVRYWAELINSKPDDPFVALFMTRWYVFDNPQSPMQLLDQEKWLGDSFPIRYYIQSMNGLSAGDAQLAMNQVVEMLARQPGNGRVIRELNWSTWYDPLFGPLAFETTMRNWYKRVPKSIQRKAFLAGAFNVAYWKYMGGNRPMAPEERPEDGRAGAARVSSEGGGLTLECLQAGPPIPWVVNSALYSSAGESEAANAAHVACVKRYPGQTRSWEAYARLLSRAWGGDEATAMPFLAECLKQAESVNPRLGAIPWEYCTYQSRQRGEYPKDALANYFKRFPDMKKQAYRGMELSKSGFDDAQSSAFAAFVYICEEDWRKLDGELQRFPRLWAIPEDSMAHGIGGFSARDQLLWRSEMSLLRLGKWTELAELAQECLEFDSHLDWLQRYQVDWKYNQIHEFPEEGLFFIGMSKLFLGEKEEGNTLLDEAKKKLKGFDQYFLAAEAFAGDNPQQTTMAIDGALASDKGNTTLINAKALCLHHLGKTEEAKKILSDLQAKEQLDWPALLTESLKIIK